MASPKLRPTEIFYPDSDGQPLESDLHGDLMIDLIGSLRHHFRDDPLFYASGNLFIYFEEGNPRVSVGPDVFAVRGVPNRRRNVYKVWEEKKGPDLVVELTSKTTHAEDLKRKPAIYAKLGVKEYFLFDPEGRLRPTLRGFVLRGGAYELLEAALKPDGTLVLASQVLGLELHASGDSARWVDPQTGRPLPVPREALDRLTEEEVRANEERHRADAAEAEVARLRNELERLRDRKGGQVR